MALGNSSLNNVRNLLENINKDIKYGDCDATTEGIYSCWNTYKYVANNLKVWADDTTIGAETKQKLLKLSDILSQLIEETRMIENKISDFCDNQDAINGKKSISNNREIANPSFDYS